MEVQLMEVRLMEVRLIFEIATVFTLTPFLLVPADGATAAFFALPGARR